MNGSIVATQPFAPKQGKPSRVVKLGGSLLDLPHLGERLQNWLDGEPEKMSLLVTGGGEFVETMRRLDAIHQFDANWCHWRCIEILQLTSQMMETQLPDWLSVQTPPELAKCIELGAPGLRAIVYATAYYTPEIACLDQANERLPETWETTSDSMAAYLARRVGADELVLLKSASPTPKHSCDLGEQGTLHQSAWQIPDFVDTHFAKAAAGIRQVRSVNLRSAQLPKTITQD